MNLWADKLPATIFFLLEVMREKKKESLIKVNKGQLFLQGDVERKIVRV